MRSIYTIVNQIPFSTEKKFMATVVTVSGKTLTFVKGAPEILLNMCGCDAAERETYEKKLLHYQQQAMRTLAFAYAEGDLTNELLEGNASSLSLQGVCAICDPVRDDVPKAVDECRTAGIRVKIVTGDTTATALEIARQIGVTEGEAITDQNGRHSPTRKPISFARTYA